MTFKDFNLTPKINDAIDKINYTTPTPIQEQAIPAILEGRDILASAQTGTGKTAAFILPILHKINEEFNKASTHHIRALVITPTRELARQINDNIKIYAKYLNLRSDVVYGGVNQLRQTRALDKGLDILVATPGRLIDLYNQGFVNFSNTTMLVLDEADTLLDMGFIRDIKLIVSKLSKNRQSMLFSATINNEVADLARNVLNDPLRIDIEPEQKTVDAINQAIYEVNKHDKFSLLVKLLQERDDHSVLIFARTKRGANNIAKRLNLINIKTEAIHSDKSQSSREKALDSFKARKVRVLVATDIASRGLDISKLPLVINFDIPELSESYIHRIGRTGRAGENGIAISFVDVSEKRLIKFIEKLIGFKIEVLELPEFERFNTADYPTQNSDEDEGRQRSRQRQRQSPSDEKIKQRRNNKKDKYADLKKNKDVVTSDTLTEPVQVKEKVEKEERVVNSRVKKDSYSKKPRFTKEFDNDNKKPYSKKPRFNKEQSLGTKVDSDYESKKSNYKTRVKSIDDQGDKPKRSSKSYTDRKSPNTRFKKDFKRNDYQNEGFKDTRPVRSKQKSSIVGLDESNLQDKKPTRQVSEKIKALKEAKVDRYSHLKKEGNKSNKFDNTKKPFKSGKPSTKKPFRKDKNSSFKKGK